VTASSVTLPVLVTTYRYVITSPTTAGRWMPAASAVLTNDSDGAATSGVSVSSVFDGVSAPSGVVPWAIAWLATCPASMSAWVIAYVAVAVTWSPEASTPTGPGHV
jgi:hypothetical protein